MNVAIVQPVCVERSRAAGLQAVLDGVDAACGSVPGPDVVVLPGFASTCGVPPGRSWTAAMCDVSLEAFCSKAVAWGVYIALGVTEPAEGRAISVAALIDPDGDVAAQASAGGGPAISTTALGNIGVAQPEAFSAGPTWDEGAVEADLLVVPVSRGLSVKRRRLLREAVIHGVEKRDRFRAEHVVLACAGGTDRKTEEAEGPGTVVIGAAGELLSSPGAEVPIVRVRLGSMKP